MSKIIRMDRSGHTIVAEWVADDAGSCRRAAAALSAELERGYYAVASHPDGTAEQIRDLPGDGPLVVLRRPIAGG